MDVPGPGVQVVANVPVAGPVPPPIIVVMPRVERLVDLLRTDEMDVRVDAAGGDDHAFAGDDLGARADDDRSTPVWTSGLPALPMPTMRPSLMPMSALTMPHQSIRSARW